MHNKIYSSIQTQKIVTVIFLGPPSVSRSAGLDLDLIWSASINGVRVDPDHPEVTAAVKHHLGYHEIHPV